MAKCYDVRHKKVRYYDSHGYNIYEVHSSYF